MKLQIKINKWQSAQSEAGKLKEIDFTLIKMSSVWQTNIKQTTFAI